MKYPKTPDEVADALMEWFERGKGGLVCFCRVANPEAQKHAERWFEKGRAKINGLVDAIRNLDEVK